MGKRKIEIKRITDRQQRSVTFSKRRDGLFKKAETACQKFGGLQIGIVAFSPAGKPFTFCNSSSVSLDAIIDTYLSSSGSSSSSSTSPAVVMGKRSRSDGGDDDHVQVIETEKKKKKRKTIAVDPCITVQEEEEEEKLDQGFHYKNLDSAQIYDQELTNEELMGYGENEGIVTEEMINMESSQCLVEGDTTTTYSWAPPDVEFQETINVEDDFEYADHHHHHHCDAKIMGLFPPHPATTTTSTSLCDLMTASDMNEEEEEEVGGANEEDDYGYTLEEWEQIFSSSPTSVVDSTVVGNSTLSSSSCMNQEFPSAWPTQEFLQLLCS